MNRTARTVLTTLHELQLEVFVNAYGIRREHDAPLDVAIYDWIDAGKPVPPEPDLSTDEGALQVLLDQQIEAGNPLAEPAARFNATLKMRASGFPWPLLERAAFSIAQATWDGHHGKPGILQECEKALAAHRAEEDKTQTALRNALNDAFEVLRFHQWVHDPGIEDRGGVYWRCPSCRAPASGEVPDGTHRDSCRWMALYNRLAAIVKDSNDG